MGLWLDVGPVDGIDPGFEVRMHGAVLVAKPTQEALAGAEFVDDLALVANGDLSGIMVCGIFDPVAALAGRRAEETLQVVEPVLELLQAAAFVSHG